MAGSSQQKLKLLHLLNIFKHQTDEEHPLTAIQLAEELQKRGVTAERKSIYGDIVTLQEYGLDIMQTRVPARGFFLASRDFELAEVRLLMDAVQSAGFITPKKTKELVQKLEGLTSDYQAKEIGRQVYIDSRVKYNNEEIYYTIDKLHKAILAHQKITFFYYRRRLEKGDIVMGEKRLRISPYALLWSKDHYYLIGNNEKYDNLIHLRIDRMRKVEPLPEKARPFEEVSEYQGYFDIADYSSRIFNAFGGENELVQLRCKNEYAEEILDQFGDNISIKPSGEGYFSFVIKVAVSEGFIGSILSYGDAIEVLSPRRVREQVASKADKLAELYRK